MGKFRWPSVFPPYPVFVTELIADRSDKRRLPCARPEHETTKPTMSAWPPPAVYIAKEDMGIGDWAPGGVIFTLEKPGQMVILFFGS
jgi:hypothetical protein